MRLPPPAVYQLINSKVDEFEAILRKRIANWDNLPADAQLAVLSMAWAMGPGFRYPGFLAALSSGDFDTAMREAHMPDEKNAGLVPRNAANKQLLANAGQVVRAGAPLDNLIFDVAAFAKKSAAQIQAAAAEAAQIVQRNPGKSALGVTVALAATAYGAWFLYRNQTRLTRDVPVSSFDFPIVDGV